MEARFLAIAGGLVALALAVGEAAPQHAPHDFIERDGRFYVNMNVTLLEDFSLVQEEFCWSWYHLDLGWNDEIDAGWSNVAMGRRGELVPKHPWVFPALSTPFFFAFGLGGLLVFNLLALALAAGGGALFARGALEGARGPTNAAALTASLAFVVGAGVLRYAYNYSVDVALLALWLAGLGAIAQKRGALAGALFAITVCLKPTALMWMPSVLILALAARDKRMVLRALLAGTAVLVLYAAANAWIFGRPWYTGYTRTVIRSGGELVVTDNVNLFGRELLTGLKSNWRWTRTYFAVLLLGAPGLLSLLRRRPWTFLATLVAIVTTEVVFALYVYEGDRFHWPGLSFLIPALAESVRLLGVVLERRGTPRPVLVAAALGAALFGYALFYGPFAVGGAVGDGALARGATLLAAGELDARAQLPEVQLLGEMGWADSTLSLSRYGHWWPRTPIVAAAALAPFGLFGQAGLFLAFLLLAGAFAAAIVALGPRGRSPELSAAAVATAAVFYAWPSLRGATLDHGAGLLGTAALAGAAWLASRDAAPGLPAWRPRLGLFALAFVGAASLEAPYAPLALAPLVLPERRRDAMVLVLAGALAALVSLAWLGRPLATVNDMVLVTLDTPDRVAVPWIAPPATALALALVGLPGLVLALRGPERRRAAAALLLGALGAYASPELLAAVGAAGLPLTAHALATALEGRGRGRALAFAAALLMLFAGAGWRSAAASAPLRLASPEGVRRALVHHGNRPCDFLVWEHTNWECAGVDRNVELQAGLASDAPHRYGGEPLRLFHLATASGRARSVSWEHVRLPATLPVRLATPDHAKAGGQLRLLVDGEIVATRDLGEPVDETWSVDLGEARDDATLGFVLQGPGVAIGLDAELPR